MSAFFFPHCLKPGVVWLLGFLASTLGCVSEFWKTKFSRKELYLDLRKTVI